MRKKAKGKGKVMQMNAASKPRTKKRMTQTSPEETLKVLKTDEAETTAPPDFAEARKMIAELVRLSAVEIATSFLNAAKTGQVAPAKYLFEAVGLYPATEETPERAKHSLAYTLLKRMGLPTEPVDAAEGDGKCDGEWNSNAGGGEERAGQHLERREDAVK
jgi:hypothetical protein